MKSRLLWMGALAVAAGCGRTTALDSADLAGVGQDKKQLSGAIFTTTADGTRVNANQYEEMCDVYLNGGPSKEGAAGLPEGDYYFQVTSPSEGKPSELLSTDDVANRQIHVDETGRITGNSGAGDHVTGTNEVDGGATIQLCPFLDTPNPGCVFKVWLTPVEDYDLEGKNATFGFLSDRSKTDNFKVCSEIPPPPPPPPGAECGNGVVEGDEECDDGNDVDDDECSNVCTLNGG